MGVPGGAKSRYDFRQIPLEGRIREWTACHDVHGCGTRPVGLEPSSLRFWP